MLVTACGAAVGSRSTSSPTVTARVWMLDGRDVSIRRDGRVADRRSTLHDDRCRRWRIGSEQRQPNWLGPSAIGAPASSSSRIDGTDFDLVEVDCVAAPEHATTEERTGASIIGWRLRIERGEALPAEPPAGDGVAVEARLLAEDPDADVQRHARAR